MDVAKHLETHRSASCRLQFENDSVLRCHCASSRCCFSFMCGPPWRERRGFFPLFVACCAVPTPTPFAHWKKSHSYSTWSHSGLIACWVCACVDSLQHADTGVVLKHTRHIVLRWKPLWVCASSVVDLLFILDD